MIEMTEDDIDYLICRLEEVCALLDMGEIHMAKAKLLADISALTAREVNFSDYIKSVDKKFGDEDEI